MENQATSLNPAQKQAVQSDSMHALILAGAGSGKTRVLVQRIVWLVQKQIASPHHILAVTFTNKAAKEMFSRIQTTLNLDARDMWVGTFHGIAHRILRLHYEKARLPKNFQILDSQESKSIVRSLIKQNQMNDFLEDKDVRGFIDWQKENARRSDSCIPTKANFAQKVHIYSEYEKLCDANGWVDFAELLLRVYELLVDKPIIAEIYHNRFKHILVDEFQDTNTIQYLLLKVLNNGGNQFFVVGDDDQSIYSWRGAKIENIRSFERDFDGVDVIRLEQNYRSTAPILKAANSVIAKNSKRYPKELWTEVQTGELIDIFSSFNDLEEARYVIGKIEQAQNSGTALSQMAILYRTNAQSRVFEEQLLSANIRYIIYGGLRFYERAEIKDAMAYLKLLIARDDDLAFERVIQTPTRGIGARTLEKLREVGSETGCSLWQAIQIADEKNLFNKRTSGLLQEFKSSFNELDKLSSDLDLASTLDTIIQHSRLINHYHKEPERQRETREENLSELIRAADEFDDFEEGISQRNSFCDHAALESGELQAKKGTDAVQLMSLHSAKGLEFDMVFIVGIEEGLFPSHRSIYSSEQLEEERRLFYVGITRAKKKLSLSYAQSRKMFGQSHYNTPSRFINELPGDCIKHLRVKTENRFQSFEPKQPAKTAEGKKTFSQYEQTGYKTGQQVKHDRFGSGVVIGVQGEKIYIHFKNAGQKCLIASLAKLH